MRRSPRLFASFAAVLALGAAIFAASPSRTKPPAQATKQAPAEVAHRMEPERVAPSPVPVATIDERAALVAGLASEDEAVRIAAVEAAIRSTATSTLTDLERFDLARDPETAPTVIHAIALLGASASDRERDQAADTLRGWLDHERKRDAPDARGNVSNMVEALGDLGGPKAVQALDAMLDGDDAALHLQTLAVQKLGALGDGNARQSVQRFAERAAALPPGEGLDAELRTEAIAAASETLAKL